MLLKTEAELIEIEKRALRVLDYLDRQRDQFERDFPDKYPPPVLLQAGQAREDFHYLINMVRRIDEFFPLVSVENWRVGGLPSASSLLEARPLRSLL